MRCPARGRGGLVIEGSVRVVLWWHAHDHTSESVIVPCSVPAADARAGATGVNIQIESSRRNQYLPA